MSGSGLHTSDDVPGAAIAAPGAVSDAGTAAPAGHNSGIVIGHDAIGNVLVTGDGNTVAVTLTVVVADNRLRAAEAAAKENPHRGLDAFRETDSNLFFGRDDMIRKLWTRFHALQRGQAPRILPILGASGSGKSSLVRAGLVPELVRQPMEGMREPKVLVLRPGANPLQRLAYAVTRATPPGGDGTAPNPHAAHPDAVDALHRAAQAGGGVETRVVIFVDQLEELYMECTSEAARAAFLATLAHAASQPDGVVSVVFAMRSDFASSVRADVTFAAAVRESALRVAPMSGNQLTEAIEGPARLLKHPWPTGLAASLVLQCEGRSGALPLLQFALKRLWAEHVAGPLDDSRWSSRLIEDYLVKVADALVESSVGGTAHAARERMLRRGFVAMVQLGEGSADTRRTRLSEIVARGKTEEEVRAALAPFVAPEARLVTASELDGEPTYELAHEALIGARDRLRAWLGHLPNTTEAEAVRSRLRLRRGLRHAAHAWQAYPSALQLGQDRAGLDARTGMPLAEPLAQAIVSGRHRAARMACAWSPRAGTRPRGIGHEDGQAADRAPRPRRERPFGGVQPRWRARGHRERGQDRAGVGREDGQAAVSLRSRTASWSPTAVPARSRLRTAPANARHPGDAAANLALMSTLRPARSPG